MGPDDRAALFHPGWFHPGALTPDFAHVDIRATQECAQYARWPYVTSDVTPGFMFVGSELEFNAMTKYFYTDRDLPKKKLTDEEMIEINDLYRVIGGCLRQRSREMAPCPLLFPLPDKDQRVTPVGSYLSYLGMKRASYLPETVFRIPNIGEVFQSLELFTAGPRPMHAMFRQELPYRFMAIPVFTRTGDLVRGAHVEPLFRNSPGLVDRSLGPDSGPEPRRCLPVRSLAIHDQRPGIWLSPGNGGAQVQPVAPGLPPAHGLRGRVVPCQALRGSLRPAGRGSGQG
jgi:hypothetical protein